MLSPSSIKDEPSRQMPGAHHCQTAETTTILSLCGKVKISASDYFWTEIHTENVAAARKCSILLRRTFNIRTDVSIRSGINPGRSRTYIAAIGEYKEVLKVLQAVKFINSRGEIGENLLLIRNMVLQDVCCRRAFIRDVFLATGSVSASKKFYHFEIAYPIGSKAGQLKNIIATFDVEAKIVPRKKYYVVYTREGSQIVDILNVMEALVSPTEPENIRIVKEVRGSVNCQANCETVDINKTVSIVMRQIEDVRFIQSIAGLPGLSESLREMAHIRLERPEATLRELGGALEPPVGKPDVNHRLGRLSLMAEELRQQFLGRNISSLQRFYQARISTGI